VVTQGFGSDHLPDNTLTKCFLGQYSMVFVLNMFRMLCFFLYMQYISRHCFFYFPLPFAWIFRDFSKFIFEPYCIRIFESYLQEREPESRLR
jgi:hypothetical protein